MICHEFVQRVRLVGIITTGFCAIEALGIGNKLVDGIDVVGSHNIVRLGKHGVAVTFHSRHFEHVFATYHLTRRIRGNITLVAHTLNFFVKPGKTHSLGKNRETPFSLYYIGKEFLRRNDYVTHNMDNPVVNLDILFKHGHILVDIDDKPRTCGISLE